ncbi:disulfide oxidoreductase [Bacillus mexicanus]|uniref:disulfide oxidoreductase n=1 Tax=Bacillus mexicanus TaxID=2834415 RepID=UPI003D1B7FA5
MIKKVNPFFFPWIVSIIATSGSLFFSEAMKFIPCTLCWYQRILMYPLVFFFAFGFFKKDKNLFLYTYPMILLGNIISFYHFGIQKLGFYHPIALCQNGINCGSIYINWFGFITIPLLSLTAFTLLHIYFWIQYSSNLKQTKNTDI